VSISGEAFGLQIDYANEAAFAGNNLRVVCLYLGAFTQAPERTQFLAALVDYLDRLAR
jgi:hypothetical protein